MSTEPPSNLTGTVINRFKFPYRFNTIEGARKALYENDFSEEVFPFEKDDATEVRKEYAEAPYELDLISHADIRKS